MVLQVEIRVSAILLIIVALYDVHPGVVIGILGERTPVDNRQMVRLLLIGGCIWRDLAGALMMIMMVVFVSAVVVVVVLVVVIIVIVSQEID